MFFNEHLLQNSLTNITQVRFIMLNLIQNVRAACESDRFDILANLDVREQAIETFILRCQVIVFYHLSNKWSILIKWIIWISIHLVFFLDLLLRCVCHKESADLLEGLLSHLPLGMEALILKRHILGLIGLIRSLMDGRSSTHLRLFVIINVP